MPILAAYGPGRDQSLAAARGGAARGFAVLPMPSLEWHAEVERATAHLYERIKTVVPAVEWPFFAPYVKAINELKEPRGAVILAHNYQTPEIYHCVADFVGDSLALAREAAKTKASVVVQCGVHFMAETAKILNPSKRVLLPDLQAGCSLAESCPAEKLARFQEMLRINGRRFQTVTYINSTATVKALSDWVVTSGNAQEIIRRVP